MTAPHVAIVSSQRPVNVPHMEALCAPIGPWWYVPPDQADEYRYAGAHHVVEVEGLCGARNAALRDAAGGGHRAGLESVDCLQLSDDLRKLGLAHGPARADVEPITVQQAMVLMMWELVNHDAHLAGVAPTSNPYFAKDRVHESAFIVGDMILVRAGCPLQFDEAMLLKEDYDYTCQHLATYGRVARLDNVLADFAHRKNRGGAVAYRSPAMEQRMIAHLIEKWPEAIKPNPRRPNEVLLRWNT